MRTREREYLGRERYAGICMTRAHKSERTARAISTGNCYRIIMETALKELGQKRLAAILDRPKYATWAFKLLYFHHTKLSRASRARLVARVAKNGDADQARTLLSHDCCEQAIRMPLIKKIAAHSRARYLFLTDDQRYLPVRLLPEERKVMGIS